MRIITGKAKGCKLKAPKGMQTRPTTDRVKESLFNILGENVISAHVLDIFAGSGALGLEALSRGAENAVFIDFSRESSAVIAANAKQSKLETACFIMQNDMKSALSKLSAKKASFDLVFCDPPYNQGLVAETLSLLDESSLLTANCIIVVEHSKHESPIASWTNFLLRRSEKYGETILSFFSGRKPNEA